MRFAQTAAGLAPQSVPVLITVGRLQLAERMFGDTEATFRQVLLSAKMRFLRENRGEKTWLPY